MKPQGFIALVSVLVVGFALLALVAASAARSLFAGFDELDAADAAGAQEAALSCARIAGLMLEGDAGYAGGDALSVGGAACRIERADDGIVVSGAQGDARAYGVVRFSGGAIASYEAIPTMPE